MSQPEDTAQSSKETMEDIARTTDTMENIHQDMEDFEQLPQTTDEFERLSRDTRRKIVSGRRTTVHHPTGALPQLHTESTGARSTWRQAVHLREENMRLRVELEEKRNELQEWIRAYNEVQAGFEKEAAIIHSGYQQEVQHYQNHLQAMIEERNRMQTASQESEKRYQELYHTFQDAVEEEARKLAAKAKQAPEQVSSGDVSVESQNVTRVLDYQTRKLETQHLMETVYLKSQVTQMAAQLDTEYRQLDEERRRLVAMQQTAREQAELRQKVVEQRFRARWSVTSLTTSIGLLVLLVVLQFIFLFAFHVPVIAPISLALLAPIILCIVLACVFSQPLKFIALIYRGGLHKKKTAA